ncbi:autotaxin-like, partial [Saccoglossus kowalevskii]
MSFNDRVDRVVEWLEKSKSSRPDVIMLYMNATRYGTYKERREDLEDADEAVGRLMGGLTMLNLRDCSNVILVADWTLTNKSCNRVFNIDDYVTDLDNYQITPDWLNSVKRLNYTYNPYPNDYTDVVEYESTETTIEHFKCKNSFVQTYAKEELPVRLHYVNSPRIENIVMV